MSSLFDRFRDLDDLKARAEELVQQGIEAGRRQAALTKLRVQILDLERRMNAEFRVLGERVWGLHQLGSITAESLAGAFDKLEELAEDIAAARDKMEAILSAEEDEGEAEDEDDEPAAPTGEEHEHRRIETEGADRPDSES